jgi:hypothetical protein
MQYIHIICMLLGGIMAELDEMRERLNLLPDEELLEILQERDYEQWRPEVFDLVGSILHARGISPEKQSAEEETAPEEGRLDESEAEALGLVTVANYPNHLDAEADRSALEAEGLQVWLLNQESQSAQDLGERSVQLKVRRQDWRAAMVLLKLIPEQPVPSSDLPDDIAEPPCPKCGSRNVMEQSEVSEDAPGFATPDTAWLYHCSSCGYKWAAE